jgi:flagellar biosynthetic protein FlhB
MKESDGNPQSKARIRKLQRQSRRKQMLKAAETATVVITNPTHYAVALRYEVNMAAPIVVAKGLDNLAAKIKEIAWQRDIPVMENRPLAQSRYRAVEVGDPIPSALYHAVAEILVMVYKAQAEVRNREAQRRASMVPQAQARPL